MGLKNFSGYFDFAEIQTKRHNPMYMSDYVGYLDNVLKRQEKNYCREQGQSVMHRQWKKQQKNIKNIKCRIYYQLKKNV